MNNLISKLFSGVARVAFCVAVTGVMALTCASAQAAHFQNTTGLTGSFTTETFDAGVAGLAANQFSGLSFGPNLYVTNITNVGYPNMSGEGIANYSPSGCPCVSPTSFSFTTPVSAAAFSFVTNPGTSTFSTYLGNTLVESFSAPTSASILNNFYGFTGITFNSIKIDSGGSNNAFALDNLQSVSAQSVSAVPEPETYAMLLAGLGLIGFIAYRRKNDSSNMLMAA